MSHHWFEPVADDLGPAYLRYSFTKGTDQEVAFLVDALGLRAGDTVLDVGCGPGRHSHALARQGINAVGVDISARFVELAAAGSPPGAWFVRADARALPVASGFDAAISLCQGAFGLSGGPPTPRWPRPADELILANLGAAVQPGAKVAVSAFSAYFQVRFLSDTDEFDAASGVNHEQTSVRDEAGATHRHDLWTTCYTPGELRLLAAAVGLEVTDVWSVEPGRYRSAPPSLDQPEFLLVAQRPAQYH